MKFNLDRRKSQQKVAVTPWEKYQDQERHRQAAAKKKHRQTRIGKKLPQLLRQKHRRLAQRMGIVIGLFTVVLVVALYFATPISHISTIKVTGNQALSVNQLSAMTGIKRGNSIYKVRGREKAIAKRVVAKNARIKQIRLSITHMNVLTIHVSEYRTAGYVPANGYYRVALESGVVTNEHQTQPTGSYPVYDKFNSQTKLAAMIKQYAKLPQKIKSGISEIQFKPSKANPERIHLFMNDGNEVYASLSTFATKMAYYPSIAAKMKTSGVVNLEVGAYSYAF